LYPFLQNLARIKSGSTDQSGSQDFEQ